MANINEFRAHMTQSGARANAFRVLLTFPTVVTNGVLAGQKTQFLAKSASLPASNIGEITVNYRGRPIKFGGERTFDSPWSLTIYNDNDFIVRNAFEAWIDTISSSDKTVGSMNALEYQVDATVQQLDKQDNIIKEYTFHDMFPTSVGSIGLDWDTNDAIETFDVSLAYSYYVPKDSASRGPR